MTVLTRERAPAKINLCLYLGPTRDDGRHELVTVFDAVSLFDDLEVTAPPPTTRWCAKASAAPTSSPTRSLALRAAGWEAPPVRVTITKRIPVAAGMGGGSADAAALLRLAPRLGALPDRRLLLQIAAALGADVPSQLVPGPWLGTGAGTRLQSCAAAVALWPGGAPAAVPALDRRRVPRGRPDRAGALGGRARRRCAPGSAGSFARELIVNDLEPAALSLAPRLGETLGAIGRAGADDAIVCGSGPTLIGLFWGADGGARAREAALAAAREHPAVVTADPVRGGDGAPAANE